MNSHRVPLTNSDWHCMCLRSVVESIHSFCLILLQMEVLQPNLDIYFGLASHISDPTHSGKADYFWRKRICILKADAWGWYDW